MNKKICVYIYTNQDILLYIHMTLFLYLLNIQYSIFYFIYLLIDITINHK